jgi:hypothetical protein
MRFDFPAAADLKRIGKALTDLGRLRNRADYELLAGTLFRSNAVAQDATTTAANAVTLLDQIDADPGRRAAAIAAIQVAFP